MSRRAFGAYLGAVLLAAAMPGQAQPPMPVVAVERADRRDPFRPPRLGVGKTAALDGTRTPLEGYELGQLRLVAVIYGNTQSRAVVEDDQGLGFIVKQGTRIGPNGGEVASIDRGRMVVREMYVDFYGERRPTETVLEMKTQQRKGKP